MKLRELEPELLRYEERDGRMVMPHVDELADAMGVMFLCPKCYVTNGGKRGTHRVICWSRSRGVPDDAKPGPGRWMLVGTSLDDLTLEADPPGGARSVQLNGGCGWHGFITNGEVT